MKHELAHPWAALGFGQGIGYFHQNQVGGEDGGAEVARESQYTGMVLITPIEPRNKIKGIGKDDAHDRA
jgi:hypothetical protein